MDLNNLDTIAPSNAGAEIEILHPVTKASMGVFIKVAGKDSDIVTEYKRETTNAANAKEVVAKRKGKVAEPKSFDETEDQQLDFLSMVTLGWRTVAVPADERKGVPAVEGGAFVLFNGEQLKCTVSNARKLYAALPVVAKQINDAVLDYENFMKT